jgi:hypothetical protein
MSDTVSLFRNAESDLLVVSEIARPVVKTGKVPTMKVTILKNLIVA